MAKIFITKGKLLKDSTEIHYIKHNDDDDVSTGSETFTAPVADSLRKAFEKLSTHAALIGEFIDERGFEDISKPTKEMVSMFVVTGFTIKGGEEMKGVVLSARRIISQGKQLGFNTPLLYFKDDSEEAYLYTTELFAAIKHCQTELVAYMGGKHGNLQQQKLELKTPKDNEPDGEENTEQKSVKKAPKKAKKSPNKKDIPADDRVMDDFVNQEQKT